MMIEPVFSERVLFDNDLKLMIVSDLHIGVCEELRSAGIIVPDQTESMLSKLRELVNMKKPEKLFVIGDVKHTVSNPEYKEIWKIQSFFKELIKLTEVEIIPGNHDGLLKNILPDLKVHSNRGVRIDGLYMAHGHTWPAKKLDGAETLILGHIHPEIAIQDSQGNRQIESCWLKGTSAKTMKNYYDFEGSVIIMPAFNTLAGKVLEENSETIGPFFKNRLLNLSKMDVYLLDGTNLGKVFHQRRSRFKMRH